MERVAGIAQHRDPWRLSWLNKVRVTGPDAGRFLNFATVKDISRIQIGQIMYTPMTNEDGKVAIEGLTLHLDEKRVHVYAVWRAKLAAANPEAHRL